MALIQTFFKEEESGRAKAEIHEIDDGYVIKYYDPRGELVKEEPQPSKYLQFAEDAAENWALGIRVLNG